MDEISIENHRAYTESKAEEFTCRIFGAERHIHHYAENSHAEMRHYQLDYNISVIVKEVLYLHKTILFFILSEKNQPMLFL